MKKFLVVLSALTLVSCTTMPERHDPYQQVDTYMFSSMDDALEEAKRLLDVDELFFFNIDHAKLSNIKIKSISYNLFLRQKYYWDEEKNDYFPKTSDHVLKPDGIYEFGIFQNFLIENNNECFGVSFKSYIGFQEVEMHDGETGQTYTRDAELFNENTFDNANLSYGYFSHMSGPCVSSDKELHCSGGYNPVSYEIKVPENFWETSVSDMFSNGIFFYDKTLANIAFDIYTHYGSEKSRSTQSADTLLKDFASAFYDYGYYAKY